MWVFVKSMKPVGYSSDASERRSDDSEIPSAKSVTILKEPQQLVGCLLPANKKIKIKIKIQLSCELKNKNKIIVLLI